MKYICDYSSPLGNIVLTSDGSALTGLRFEEPGQRDGVWQPSVPVFRETARWLELYFSGTAPDFLPPLAPEGSEFRKEVWALLLTVPWGHTVTYGQLGQLLAQRKGLAKMSAQAIGGALAHNPILLLLPCHRVIGTSGHLTGYAGGLDRKAALLAMERL